MASTVQKVTMILDGSKGWHDWLEVVKTKIRAGKITLILRWPPIRFKLVELKIPKSSDVKEGAVSLVDLTDDDLKKFQQFQRAVELELREFELVR
jgi:hypothetical protein